MYYKVTKAILNLKNGDQLVKKESILTENLEQLRTEMHANYPCTTIEFVYEETTLEVTVDYATDLRDN